MPMPSCTTYPQPYRGVECIVCNQYALASEVNSASHHTLLNSLLQDGSDVGLAVDRWRRLSEWGPPGNHGGASDGRSRPTNPRKDARPTTSDELKSGHKSNKSTARSTVDGGESPRGPIMRVLFEPQPAASESAPAPTTPQPKKHIRVYDKFNPIILGLHCTKVSVAPPK